MTAKDWIAIGQAIITLGLLVIAGITLKRASATVLQPVRTEVFKAQLEELRGLLRFLAIRDEVHLRELFGLDQLVQANAVWLHDRFFRDVFGVAMPTSERQYATASFPSSLVSDGALGRTPEFSTHPARGQDVAVATFKPAKNEDPRAWWSGFTIEELKLPLKWDESVDQLRQAAASPLLPARIAERLRELIAAVDSSTRLLFEILSKAGRELPSRFAAPAAPETFEVGWISDRYYGQMSALQPRVAALQSAIREYLAVDSLMKPW